MKTGLEMHAAFLDLIRDCSFSEEAPDELTEIAANKLLELCEGRATPDTLDAIWDILRKIQEQLSYAELAALGMFSADESGRLKLDFAGLYKYHQETSDDKPGGPAVYRV